MFIRELEVKPHINAAWFLRSVAAGSAAVGLTALVGCPAENDDVTTLALGEEGGDDDPVATTLAVGEEDDGPPGDVTTLALGEEGGGNGGDNVTTFAIGEE